MKDLWPDYQNKKQNNNKKDKPKKLFWNHSYSHNVALTVQNLLCMFFSFYHAGSWGQTQVLGRKEMYLYLLSHVSSPGRVDILNS